MPFYHIYLIYLKSFRELYIVVVIMFVLCFLYTFYLFLRI